MEYSINESTPKAEGVQNENTALSESQTLESHSTEFTHECTGDTSTSNYGDIQPEELLDNDDPEAGLKESATLAKEQIQAKEVEFENFEKIVRKIPNLEDGGFFLGLTQSVQLKDLNKYAKLNLNELALYFTSNSNRIDEPFEEWLKPYWYYAMEIKPDNAKREEDKKKGGEKANQTAKSDIEIQLTNYKLLPVCAYFEIVAILRSVSMANGFPTDRGYLRIKWKECIQPYQVHQADIPLRRFSADELIADLKDQFLHFPGDIEIDRTKKRRFLLLLNNSLLNTKLQKILVQNAGWKELNGKDAEGNEISGWVYVFPPNTVIAEAVDRAINIDIEGVVNGNDKMDATPKGTLQEWQTHIAKVVLEQGWHTYVYSIADHLSAPLRGTIGGLNSYIVCFLGSSSIGKTRASLTGISVEGCYKSISDIPNWNSTANGISDSLPIWNHRCVFIDELKSLDDSKSFQKIVMGVSNNSTRRRSSIEGTVRPVNTFEGIVETSTEFDFLQDGGVGGHEVRCLVIPMKKEDYLRDPKFIDEFGSNLKKFNGTCLPELLKRLDYLINTLGLETYRKIIADRVEQYKRVNSEIATQMANVKKGSPIGGRIDRVSEYHAYQGVALDIACGGLNETINREFRKIGLRDENGNAIDYQPINLLGWDSSPENTPLTKENVSLAYKSILKCFMDWMEYTKVAEGTPEERMILQNLEIFLNQNLGSMVEVEPDPYSSKGKTFRRKDSNLSIPKPLCGAFWDELKNGKTIRHYFFPKTDFRKQFCNGKAYSEVASLLRNVGFEFDGVENRLWLTVKPFKHGCFITLIAPIEKP